LRAITGCLAAFCLVVLSVAAQADTLPKLTPEQQATVAKLQAIAAKLHPQFGDVAVPGAGATLHLGKSYYFLPADQARLVLVDAWHNPPDAADGIAGIVFPAGKSFADDTWAAVVTYEASGYVADDDAKDVDYAEMLKSEQDAEPEQNDRRKQQGYDSLHFVGWAQPPYYDTQHHSLIWARELQVGNNTPHTLNYDLRELGRSGVLSMNIIAAMPDLPVVRSAANQLQNIGTFNAGSRYADYQAGIDKKAAYGIGGLVAAGIGVAVAQKLGFLGIILLFAKKFIVVLLAAGAGAIAWLRRLFTGKGKEPPATA
jgi:uncharacterized membrane-anchored protein